MTRYFVHIVDEREDVQKKTFTKWINAQFSKVRMFYYFSFKIGFAEFLCTCVF